MGSTRFSTRFFLSSRPLVGLAGLALVILAGCGGDDPTPTANAAPAFAAASPESKRSTHAAAADHPVTAAQQTTAGVQRESMPARIIGTDVAVKPPEGPVILGTRDGPAGPGADGGNDGPARDTFRSPTRATAYVGECLVDFTDPDALTFTGYSLWFDRLYVPWLQRCGAGGYLDLRPSRYGHLHLGFESEEVVPCNTHPQAYPARLDDAGECDLVDIATEPRTHVTTHGHDEFIHVRTYSYNSALPDYTPLVFDLNRIRVTPISSAIRLCYRKAGQPIDGTWITSGPDGGSPGVWLCWKRLATGYWDLSDWATELSDVRITGADGEIGPFSIDDLQAGIR